LDRWEYMRLNIKDIPQAVIDHYNLLTLVQDGFVMVAIMKGIYGLPQAGILAKKLLDERLLTDGYYPAPNTPGLYLHRTRKISFTLWVDDFSLKYVNKDDADHLIHTLSKYYVLKEDWSGTKYLGLTLKWDYTNRCITFCCCWRQVRLLLRR
jgi:hypothetical protein